MTKLFFLLGLLVSILLSVSCGPKQTPLETTAPTLATIQATTTIQPSPSSHTSISSKPPASTPITRECELKVHFIDVGQGDAILIDLYDVEVLIVAGDKSPGVTNYLRNYVDGPLEVVVATHPHADHIGGLIDVLASFDVEQIWHNGEASTSKTYQDFMNAVQSEGAEIKIARLHDVIQAGELSFKVHHPTNLEGTTNNNSIVLHLAYSVIDFLFMGDAEKEAEEQMMMLSSLRLPEVEILKVGHHGSRTASSKDFLSFTSPEVAIYMAGEDNTYGHPHQETIEALSEIGAEIYGTDVHGNIIVTTDGNKYEILLQKQAPAVTIDSILTATVTPTPTPSTTPTSTPTPSFTSSESINVKITKIFYDGVVPRTESDEYVEITNLGNESVDLKGWVLKDISEEYPSFTFPYYILQPGNSIRVYTNEIHSEYGGFSFGSGKAVWNNSEPDTAVLYNAQGQEVSRKSY